MITVQNLAIQFGKRVLYKDVNLKFTHGKSCFFLVKNTALFCHFAEKSYFCMLKGINDIPIPLNMC